MEPGRLRQIAADQCEHGCSHVLRQDLFLEQGPLGVELAELVFWDPVCPGTVRTPTLCEDPRSPDDPIRIDAVDADAELAELRSQ